MRAARITRYGGKDVLQTVSDVPKPEPAAGQVLVAVHAAGVNPFDWKVREGNMKDVVQLELPATLGGDLSGIVVELGEGVSSFDVGDVVYGQANALSGNGSYAEFAPVKAESLAHKPLSTDFITAAALPLAGCSAYQALVDIAGLQAGQKILIHGGAGGIGSYAVQLSRHLGAYVVTTVGSDDINFAKSLGADEVIDYKTEDFTAVKDCDVVFDVVGGETAAKSYQVLKPGGVLVSMVAAPDEELMNKYNVKMVSQSSKVTTERLTHLAELVDHGSIKVNVDKVFPLNQAGEALAYIQEGKHRGKVVIKVDE